MMHRLATVVAGSLPGAVDCTVLDGETLSDASGLPRQAFFLIVPTTCLIDFNTADVAPSDHVWLTPVNETLANLYWVRARKISGDAFTGVSQSSDTWYNLGATGGVQFGYIDTVNKSGQFEIEFALADGGGVIHSFTINIALN